jgi:hypothetical protein
LVHDSNIPESSALNPRDRIILHAVLVVLGAIVIGVGTG